MLVGWAGMGKLWESLRCLKAVVLVRRTDEAIAPEGETLLTDVGHLLLREYPWRDGRAVGRTATPVGYGETTNAVELVEHGRILRTLHW